MVVMGSLRRIESMQTMESGKKRAAFRVCAAMSALAIALLLAPAAQSQDRERGPEQMQKRMQERLTRLKEDLKLTDKQVEALRPIFATQMREMRELRQSRRGGPEGRAPEGRDARRPRGGGPEGDAPEGRDAIRKLMMDTRAKIAKVLNEEQLAKFDAINQRRDRQRFRGGERGPRPNRDGDGPPPPPRGDGSAPHGQGDGPPPPGHPPLTPEPKI